MKYTPLIPENERRKSAISTVSFRRRRRNNSTLIMFLFSLIEDQFLLNEASAIDGYMNRFQLFTKVYIIFVFTYMCNNIDQTKSNDEKK